MSPTDETTQEETPVESTRKESPPPDAVADGAILQKDSTGKDVEAESIPTDGLAAQAGTPCPAPVGEGVVAGEEEPKEPGADLLASTGKRPMGDAAADDGDERIGLTEPPRKKARKERSRKGRKAKQDGPVWEPLDGVDDDDVGSDDASKRTTSTSSGAHESVPSPDEPLGAVASAPGLRTSFGSSSQILAQKTSPDMMMHNPLTTEQRNELTAAIHSGESVILPPMKKRELLWTVTPIKADWLVGATWLDIFESVLDKWCQTFKVENQKNIQEIGLAPSFLKLAFLSRLETKVTPGDMPGTLRVTATRQLKNADTSRLRTFAGQFKPNESKIAKRAAKNEARLAAQRISNADTKAAANNNPSQPTNAEVEGEIDENDITSTSGQAQDSKSDREEGEVDSDNTNTNAAHAEMRTDEYESGPPITQAELDQRHLYYPGVPDAAIFCVTCAQHGHTTAHCSEATCKHCQGDHFSYECPTRQRCGKCKQLGHLKGTCPEKLAIAQGETTIECAVCEFHDHTETNCSELWQTYHPQPGNVKKVRSIPVFCYGCGAEGHFGGDCGLADPSVPPTKTWTIATASLYVDPASNEDALAYKNCIPPAAPVGAPVIPGRSIVPQSHIFFESDESDDGGFLHAPSNRHHQQQRGSSKIQIKSNITFGASATGGPSSSYTDKQPRNQRIAGPHATPGPQTLAGTKASKPSGGRGSSKGGDARARKERQQPPLPSGPPPSFIPLQGGGSGSGGGGRRGGGGGGRGRGGFSNLKKRRTRSSNKGQGRG